MALAILPANAYAVEADLGSLSVRTVEWGSRFAKVIYERHETPADVDALLQDWIASQGVTPENSLSLDDITYQYWDDGARGRNDTRRCAGLAYEIVPDKYANLLDSDRFSNVYTRGTGPHSLDPKSVKKYRICVNRDGLYTRESIANCFSRPASDFAIF